MENSKNTWNMNMLGEKLEGINNLFDYEHAQMYQQLVEEHLNQPRKEWNEDEIERIENIFSVDDCDKFLTFQEYIDEFTNLIDKDVNSKEVQENVEKLYDYINNFLGSSVSLSLNAFSVYGQTFALGGDINMMNIERLGEKTTDFIAKAIQVYCDR